MKCKYPDQDPKKPCEHKDCDWYIIHKDYYNCFMVYQYYIYGVEHTLQEIAELMGVSHTTIKQHQEIALNKLKQAVKDGTLKITDLRKFINPKD